MPQAEHVLYRLRAVSLFWIPTVFMAIGNSPNPLISRTTEGLQVNRHGCLVLRDTESWITTRDGIYAGGDAVTGAATVILAMGAGKAAANSIDEYLQQTN